MYSYNLTEEDKKILDVLIFNDISSNELIRYAILKMPTMTENFNLEINGIRITHTHNFRNRKIFKIEGRYSEAMEYNMSIDGGHLLSYLKERLRN